MNMNWKAGDPIKAKPTAMNRSCRIDPDHATGHVCFVNSQGVSFYLDRGKAGSGYIEAQCALDLFAANFEHDPYRPYNVAYIKTTHYMKKYPNDLF